jgi:hypothetical protein
MWQTWPMKTPSLFSIRRWQPGKAQQLPDFRNSSLSVSGSGASRFTFSVAICILRPSAGLHKRNPFRLIGGSGYAKTNTSGIVLVTYPTWQEAAGGASSSCFSTCVTRARLLVFKVSPLEIKAEDVLLGQRHEDVGKPGAGETVAAESAVDLRAAERLAYKDKPAKRPDPRPVPPRDWQKAKRQATKPR